MAAYRLYHIDGAGKFSAAEWIEADGDEAALEAAEALGKGIKCELWQGGRLVGKIDAEAAARGASPDDPR